MDDTSQVAPPVTAEVSNGGLSQETRDDLKEQLIILHKNLNILREREAKYGGNAPLELLTQIDDHLTAIDLINEALAGHLSSEELGEALAPLNLALVNVGNVEATYAAIGVGAKLIVNQALSAVEEAKKQRDQEQTLLAEAVVNLADRLQKVVAQPPQTSLFSNPYKSLLEYRLEDAALFYGRSQAIEQMLNRLHRHPLTILHAESGAGKSSLLQAGLASRLLSRGDLPLHIRPWNVNPALAVKRTILPIGQAPGLAQASLFDFLHKVIHILGPDSHLYIFLDQFEEFFTQLDEATRKDFVGQLAECLEDESLRVRWVLAMRKEYFGNLATFRPEIKNPFANDYLLRPLNYAEATEVIIEPAKKQGITYEPTLIQKLLADLGATSPDGSPGEVAPPHIQLVCSALFEQLQERHAADPNLPLVITEQMYDEEGGARGILRSHLNRVLKRNLSEKERELARQLLMALVSSDRRRIRRKRDDLAATLALYLTSAQSLDDVLEQLVEGRLVRVEEEETSSAAYELAHDYLLTEIEVDPEVQAQKAAQELLDREVVSFKRYQTLLSRDKYDIIHSQETFLVLTDEARQLLRLSKAAKERWLRRIAIITLVVIAILSFTTWRAIVRRVEADEARRIAEGRRLAAEAVSIVPLDSELGLLLALEANKKAADNIEIRDTLREVLPYIRPWQAFDSHQAVLAGDWTPNGRRVALGLENGAIQIWDAETATLLATLEGHTNPVEDVRFNPQGTYLVSASHGDRADEALRLWDVAQGKEVGSFEGAASEGVYRAIWSPNGAHILSQEADDKIKLWDVVSRRLLKTAEGGFNELGDIDWRPDGQKFASVGKGSQILIWDARTMTIDTELTGHQGDVVSVAWNGDGTLLATGGADGTVRIWDIGAGHIQDVLIGHTSWVRSLAWHPNGRWLASSSDDTKVMIWDVETGRPLTSLTGHTDWVWTAAWNPTNPRQLLSASRDGTARIWDTATSPGILTLTGHVGEVKDVAWNPAGTILASVGDDRLVHLWQFEVNSTGQADLQPQGRTLPGHTDVVQSVTWSPDGAKLATTSTDKSVRLWSAITLKSLNVLTDHTELVYQTAWSPDGQILASGGQDRNIRLWDTETGQLKGTLKGHERTVLGLAFNPANGTQLASSSSDQTIILWDITTGEKLKSLTGHEDLVWSVAFSPDGQYLASASQDATVRLWEVSSGRLLVKLHHEKPVNSVAWNSDGTQLATASDDGSARIWDVSTLSTGANPELVADLSNHQGGVWSVAWRPNDSRLATAATDGVVRVFQTDFQEILELAEANQHRQLTPAERAEFLGERPQIVNSSQ
jgi:WD40 repeat protein